MSTVGENNTIALISCPCCGKKISNQAVSCPDCGHPNLEKGIARAEITELYETCEEDDLPKRRCVNCGYENSASANQCEKCRKIFEYGGYVLKSSVQDSRKLFEWQKDARCCPGCGGSRYHAFVEEVVIREGKVKTTTSLNLNPLKPFTLFNQKQKVVREPWTKQVSKFVCDDCGEIFK